MSKWHLGMIALVAMVAVGGCKKKEEAASSGGGGGTTEKAAAQPEPAAVEVSPEMQAFLAGWDGDYKKVEAALAAHGVEGLETEDMEMYDLNDPKVIARAKDGDAECFTFEAKAGMTVRTYDVCWTGGKISKVVDQGMR